MIIDGHVHLGIRPGAEQTMEELISRMDKDKVDKSIVFNFVEVLQNDYVAKAMEKYPDRVIGFATIHPWHENAKDELIRCIDKLGLKGLKMHPTLHGYSFSNHLLIDPLLEICTKFKIPVIGHGGDDIFSTPLQYEEMARTFPEVKFVIAHMGVVWTVNEAFMVAKRNENIFLGTAGATIGYIKAAVEEVGAEKVVMGTDSPFQRAKLEMQKIEEAVPDKKKQDLILGGNWARLLERNY